jgi:DNA-binding MarR family transcriptional regulator
MTILPETRLLKLLGQLSTLSVMQLPEDIELSRPAISLLTWISSSPGCGVVDIARGLHLSPPTISVGIRRLIKGGWLERRHDPEDRRARPVYLTRKGKAFIKDLRAHQTKMFRIFLSGLSTEEQDQLISLLEQAISSLEQSK